MEITIKCEPKELAALVVGLQERQSANDFTKAAMNEISRLLEKRGQAVQ